VSRVFWTGLLTALTLSVEGSFWLFAKADFFALGGTTFFSAVVFCELGDGSLFVTAFFEVAAGCGLRFAGLAGFEGARFVPGPLNSLLLLPRSCPNAQKVLTVPMKTKVMSRNIMLI
jgi:hypothetical protein